MNDEANNALLADVRRIVLADRDYHDRGVRAFVSYVRAYSKHEAGYIFRVRDLELGKVARGFGLLKVGIERIGMVESKELVADCKEDDG